MKRSQLLFLTVLILCGAVGVVFTSLQLALKEPEQQVQQEVILDSKLEGTASVLPRYRDNAKFALEEAEVADKQGKKEIANYLRHVAYTLNQAATAFEKHQLTLVPVYEEAAEYAQEAVRAEQKGNFQLASNLYQTSIVIAGGKFSQTNVPLGFMKSKRQIKIKNLATSSKQEVSVADYQQQLYKMQQLVKAAKNKRIAKQYLQAAGYAEQAITAWNKQKKDRAYRYGLLSAVVAETANARVKGLDTEKLEKAISYSKLSIEDGISLEAAHYLTEAVIGLVIMHIAEQKDEKEIVSYAGQAAFAAYQASVAQHNKEDSRLIDTYSKAAGYARQAITQHNAGKVNEGKYLFRLSLTLGRVASAVKQERNDLTNKYNAVADHALEAVRAERIGQKRKASFLHQLAFSEGEAIWRLNQPNLVSAYVKAADYAKEALLAEKTGRKELATYLQQASFALSQIAYQARNKQLAAKYTKAFTYAKQALTANKEGKQSEAKAAYQASIEELPSSEV